LGANIGETMSTDQIQLEAEYAGLITAVAPGGLGAELGLRPGDELLAINGQPLRDVIDVQFYGAEERLELLARRDGELTLYDARRDYDQPLGLTFHHPTFDIDIRRCNNLCEFCFVLQTAPRMRRTLYIKDDDYRYSFLQGHYVTLTNLADEDWDRIQEQHLSPLYVSVHASDLDLRRRVLRNPDAPDVLAQLRWLGERGIETHTQIVVTPGLNDGPHLDRSIADLATLWPAVRSVSVVPVGITRHHKYGHRPNTTQEARVVFDQVTRWQARFIEDLGVRFAYLTDEWYLLLEKPVPPARAYDGLSLEENGLGMVRRFLDDWERTKKRLDGRAVSRWGTREATHSRSATLVTGGLFAPTLARAAAELAALTGAGLDVVPVVNRRLGESITVAGLLMGQDVIDQLAGRDLGQLLVLPRIMFDHPDGIALDDVPPTRISAALGRPIALAEGMDDVWQAVAGRAPTLHLPRQRRGAG
jgi:putative radical SAM enzyme (TIGR03279 family)